MTNFTLRDDIKELIRDIEHTSQFKGMTPYESRALRILKQVNK